jgi:hypothetical protein
MTLLDETKQLRNDVAKLRPDKRRRYPDELRRRILSWVDRGTDAGQLESECAKAIGVKTWRFTMWRRMEAREATPAREPLALVQIEAPALPMSSALCLVGPSGYRVEGLTLDQVAALLRELA